MEVFALRLLIVVGLLFMLQSLLGVVKLKEPATSWIWAGSVLLGIVYLFLPSLLRIF